MKTFVSCALLTLATFVQAQNPASIEPGVATTVEVTTREGGPDDKLPWSPQQATGAPDTPNPGDYSSAWAAATLDQGEEWLMLEYAEPAVLGAVRIYESYNPGAITKVMAFTEDGRQVALVSDRSTSGKWTSEYRAPDGQEVRAKQVCLTINEPAVPGYNEIDAVGLKGKDGKLQWAISATASSFYGEGTSARRRAVLKLKQGPPSWSAAQATGEPNTELSGDFGTAWAPSTPDGGAERLLVAFDSPIRAKACEVFQSCNPGAITSVDLINAAGKPIATLQRADGKSETRPGGIAVLRLHFDSTDAVKQVRINLDTKLVPGWNEIDAVALIDQQDTSHWAAEARASTAFGGQHDHGAGAGAGGVFIADANGIIETLNSVNSALGNQVAHEGVHISGPAGSATTREKGAPWSPEQATAAPDTPTSGDFPSAWAPKEIGAGKEWLRAEFLEPGELVEVRVHDSNLPGAIVAIAAVLPDGTEVPLRISVEENAASDQPKIVVGNSPEGAVLNTRAVLVTLDTKRVPDGWPEIDAVELVARNGSRQWAARATASSTYAENLGTGPNGGQPFERAKTLEEANERMELLNRRLRALEERLQHLGGVETPSRGIR